jgi:hypothetical protein
MQSSRNFIHNSPTVSDSLLSENIRSAQAQDTSPYTHQDIFKYDSIVNMNSYRSTIAGDLRLSTSSLTSSLNSLTDTRQELLQSSHDARAQHLTHHVSSVTEITSTVTQHMTRFAGDHRFPPGRPPLDNSISRPDQTAAINKGFAAWVTPETNDKTTNPAVSWEEIRRLVNGEAPAAAGTMRLNREPFREMNPASKRCDANSFYDPEFILSSVDSKDDPQGTARRGHMLPKREMSRRLNGSPAGTKHSNDSPDRQALILQLTGSKGNSKKATIRADPAAASRQPLPSPRTFSQTALTAPPQSTFRQVETKTPIDIKYLDFVLDGRLTPDNKTLWVYKMIIRLMTQADPLMLRLYERREVACNMKPQRPLLRICDAPHNRADHRVGCVGADAQERARDNRKTAALASSLIEHGKRADWSELTPGVMSEVEQVTTLTVACASSTPCPAGHALLSKPPRKQQGRTMHRKASAPPDPATAGQKGGVDPRGAQQHTSSREPLAQGDVTSEKEEPRPGGPRPNGAAVMATWVPTDSGAPAWVSEPVTLDGALASATIDRALSSRPPRRRKRKQRGTPASLPTVAGEGGGDDSRGTQIKLPARKRDAADTEEADPGMPQLLLVEETATALRASPDHESAVPVNVPAAARPLPQQVQEREMMDSLVQAGVGEGTGQGGTECSLSSCQEETDTLSQRREFLGRRECKASTDACRENLWISKSREMRRRQVKVGNGLVGQSPTVTYILRPDARGIIGSAFGLSRMGPAGIVSARFPVQATHLSHRRGRRGRHKKVGQGRTRDARWSDLVAKVERVGSRVEPWSPQDHSEIGTVTRAAEVRSVADYPAAAGSKAFLSVLGEMPLAETMSESSWSATRQGLAKMTSLAGAPDGPGDGSGEIAGPWVTDKGGGEDALGTLDGPLPKAEMDVGPEFSSVPDSVNTWFVRGVGARRMPLVIKREDWSEMLALGMVQGPHPDLAVAFAWRRCYNPPADERKSTIRFVTHDAFDVPVDNWPTTWEGLVEHVVMGGYFRTKPRLRGGSMDSAEAQSLLDSTNFDEHLPWDEIDQNLARVRAGGLIPPNEMTEPMRLAQALLGCVALQQWDPLATFLHALPQEVSTGLILSPARLAALSVLAARPRREPDPPPPWLMAASFAELRFNHLSPSDFVPDPHRANDLRSQIQDGIVNRLLIVAPEIANHPHYRLQNLRSDLRVELNLKDPHVETCFFSAIAVLPTGPWISDFYKGVKSLGGRSFCTITPTDLHVETELSNTDQQVIRAIRSALGVDNAAFRRILDESLSNALHCDARSRDDTARFTSNGGKGGKRTMEHVSPDSPDSRLLVTMDGTSLLLARRTVIRLPLQLGPVTIGLTLPQCPQQALRSMLQPRDPAAIRLRVPGAAIDCPVILVGPLPKGSISARTVNSGAKMADLRRHMHEVCRAELRTVDVRLVGRYEKDRSPMFLYMEFGSADAAHHFGSTVDRQVPQEFARLMMSLCGDKASQMQFWSCNLLSECLAAADEKALKALMSHGQSNPCPLPPPPYIPSVPPPPDHGAGQIAGGTGSAAGGPDNPVNAQH